MLWKFQTNKENYLNRDGMKMAIVALADGIVLTMKYKNILKIASWEAILKKMAQYGYHVIVMKILKKIVREPIEVVTSTTSI